MWLSHWLPKRKRSHGAPRRRTARSPHERATHRLLLEVLEDRCVPSAGALDTTFGVGGKVTTAFLGPTNDFGLAGTAIQADGKIVEAGYSDTQTQSGGGAALVRYNTDGTLDTTFGSGGKVLPDYNSSGGSFHAVAIQGDGKIVIAGVAFPSGAGEWALIRYNSDGSLDTTFGSGGEVLTSFEIQNSDDAPNSVAIQADGKIVAAGGSASSFALARYNSDGSLDTSFGTAGKVTTAFAGSIYENAFSLGIQSDG
jgi:uncharacterized delta-60 repeat protein